MNQELKHRLIGAVVITALAAIFIPMLFDDPIDDTGQLVSEQTIPAAPGQTAEAEGGKAPSSIDQVMATPQGEASEDNGQNNNAPLNQSPASEGTPSEAESFAEEEMNVASNESENDPSKQEQQPASLDTGIIDDANSQSPATENAADESEEYTPSPAKPKNQSKPSTGNIAAPVKDTAKDIDAKTPKPSASVAGQEAKKPVLKPKETPKKAGQELVRWYLQAGSFSRKENALTLFETLKKQELPVMLETVQGSNGVLYRLKVGPELSRKRAADIKAKLEKQKIKSMLISE